MRRDSHKWYKRKTWLAIREQHLATHPLCVMCEAEGRVTDATVCDHVHRHNDDWQSFVSGPFQSLCEQHHNTAKQREEHAGFSTAAGLDGWPTDPRHPANR
jgi:5-methylcytosine-specific restriction enzyme A